MGYKALITFDLPDASDEKRKAFYDVLVSKKWKRIKSLTTSWRASFDDDVLRKDAITELRVDLANAKKSSKVAQVEYAIQIGTMDVLVESI